MATGVTVDDTVVVVSGAIGGVATVVVVGKDVGAGVVGTVVEVGVGAGSTGGEIDVDEVVDFAGASSGATEGGTGVFAASALRTSRAVSG